MTNVQQPLTQEQKDYAYARLKLQIFKEIRGLFARLFSTQNVTQSGIAQRLGVSKGLVSRRLSGEANLTLRSMAELLAAMEAKIEVKGVLFADIKEVENNRLKTSKAAIMPSRAKMMVNNEFAAVYVQSLRAENTRVGGVNDLPGFQRFITARSTVEKCKYDA